ncbi:MAG: 4a-hydroxytetrahydrobiopterin dehydratase [Actinomycetota bacterium]|nr:4a-hydroxytetrahydrobiopterin dehydratase [Actinomycetota bacterium]
MTDLLNPDALHHGLDQLPGWGGTTEGLTKTYTFADFAEAMRFVNRVADLAERAGHHPDITVRWNTVRLDVVSHSAGGVTQADLDLAAAIDTGEAHGDANPDNPNAGQTA